MKKIALGTERAAKVEALRASIASIASVDAAWRDASIIARPVKTGVPAMPLTDEQLMRGALNRAEAVRELLRAEAAGAELYVGLEGGFHSVEMDGRWHTFLCGWAYVTDGERGSFGAAPSVSVPDFIARRVIDGRRELSEVIDEVAGQQDVRSRQGAWGVLSRDLLTRSHSFEAALIAAFAPFYNAKLYT
ncbi:MAG TPA: inosine/xanthosine triphosphatase [Pyrinomonadaceae bacterium]|jgi:inosine/xanthosine triphosphatase|nr:inosine/xanthosine triphosphatase [Pyrinomonadaceae bacterium]